MRHAKLCRLRSLAMRFRLRRVGLERPILLYFSQVMFTSSNRAILFGLAPPLSEKDSFLP